MRGGTRRRAARLWRGRECWKCSEWWRRATHIRARHKADCRTTPRLVDPRSARCGSTQELHRFDSGQFHSDRFDSSQSDSHSAAWRNRDPGQAGASSLTSYGNRCRWAIRLRTADSGYGKNIFMQKQLPPAFSNSEVSTMMGVSCSSRRIFSNCGVTRAVM